MSGRDAGSSFGDRENLLASGAPATFGSYNDGKGKLMDLDEELEAMLGSVTAPAHFTSAVRSRIRPYHVTKLPEILDLIGWAGVLAATFVLLVHFIPLS